MSIAHDIGMESGMVPLPGSLVPIHNSQRPLHRIAETRRRQGLSLRSAARRLGTSMDQVRREESPDFDMPLSELYQWQQALEVPVTELLVESESTLSSTVMTRAQLLRVMKTVRSIQETTKNVSIERLSAMLEQQLVELMPELKEVTAWPSVGQRRSHNEVGRTAERVVSDTFYTDSMG